MGYSGKLGLLQYSAIVAAVKDFIYAQNKMQSSTFLCNACMTIWSVRTHLLVIRYSDLFAALCHASAT